MKLRLTLAQRFWSKVQKSDDNGCWLWTAAKTRHGYGVTSTHLQKSAKAHRVSLELSGIQVPSEKLVLHRCDTPSCVNPAHLFIGTVQDNVRDRQAKGRGRAAYGAAAGRAKLSDACVNAIRCSPLSNIELAAIFEVNASSISRARNTKTWRHI